MSTGFWAAIGLALLKLWGWLRNGKGYRATVEIRSEAAIEAEQKKEETLDEKTKDKRAEIINTAVQAARARTAGKRNTADDLDGKLRKLQEEYDNLRASKDGYQ